MNFASYPLGHMALRVSSIARAKSFYVETLHFPLLLEVPGRILVRIGEVAIAFLEADPSTGPKERFDPYRIGLDHLALSIAHEHELNGLLDLLNQHGVSNHGIEEDEMTRAKYISFYDPDGIAWELYATLHEGAIDQ